MSSTPTKLKLSPRAKPPTADELQETEVEQARTHLADVERRLADLAAPAPAPDDVEAAIETLVPTVEAAFAKASPNELRRLFDLLRVEIEVIDRDQVRLTGILEAINTLSSRQKSINRGSVPFTLDVALAA
jgi:hypothetical protein